MLEDLVYISLNSSLSVTMKPPVSMEISNLFLVVLFSVAFSFGILGCSFPFRDWGEGESIFRQFIIIACLS